MAAKVGLAAQLAKQAAQAAREEVLAAERGPGGESAVQGSKPWVLEALPDNFSLIEALQRATGQVAAHYRQILQPQGLQVQVLNDGAAGTQQLPDFVAKVEEHGTGRVVRAYTAPDLLTMFANQQQLNGVVLDGKV